MAFKNLFFTFGAALMGVGLVSADEGTTAAAKYGWRDLAHEDNFDGDSLSKSWIVYDGPGHNGKGRRSPSAVSVDNGILTISGTPDGTTAGVEWTPGQQYGRWEARARYTAGTPAYHQVLLLWPDKEDWPIGGEIDYSEVGDGDRQHLEFFLHYGKANRQESGSAEVDMTTRHNYAVEWTPDHVSGYVDGREYFHTAKSEAIPPRSMHATIQLDWFPDNGPRGSGKMEVDWIRQYHL